jgi:hypothetical protein
MRWPWTAILSSIGTGSAMSFDHTAAPSEEFSEQSIAV